MDRRHNKLKYQSALQRAIFLICIFFSLSFYAAENSPTLSEELIEKNRKISVWFDRMIEDLDLYLVGKTVSTEKAQSSIKIINSSQSIESDNFKNNTTISIVPKLPNLEKFLRISLSTYVEREEYLKAQRNLIDRDDPFFGRFEENEKTDQFDDFWKKLMTFQTSFEPRIEFQDPLKVSYALKFRSKANIGLLAVDPSLQLFADATKGVGIGYTLPFTFLILSDLEFKLFNDGEYQDRINYFVDNTGIVLTKTFNDVDVIGVGGVFTSVNRPSYQLVTQRLFLNWQHVVFKNVLDTQLVPFLEFARDRRFKGSPGFTFNLILSF